MPSSLRRTALAASSFIACACVGTTAETQPAAGPVFAGPTLGAVMQAPPRHESSGLTVSRRAPDLLWTHDDSNGEPVLYAIDTGGKKRGALRIAGEKNEDWEDVASFSRDGRAWLLIGDIGDNDAKEGSIRVHVVAEPDSTRLKPDAELTATPEYTLRIRYEDGPRDCESLAVDPAGQAIYLLTKRDAPPRLYRVPLGPSREKFVTAKFAGTVPVAGSTEVDRMLKKLLGKKIAWPTGMDFSADGRFAAVLTYGEVLVFPRQGEEAWPVTLQRAPRRLPFHGLPQAEAVCFSADSRVIYVASEGEQPLARYELR
ncbi:MAG TPA: hypothetical protein VM029_01480 [Opitutaceae bacterium]|nr:hypothetical protein [Opitutaceae bacterium]